MNGTVIGFRIPGFVEGLNVPGYHFHFITSDHTTGGHVLDMTVKDALISIDQTPEFAMVLPTAGDFYQTNLSADLSSELEFVEKDH